MSFTATSAARDDWEAPPTSKCGVCSGCRRRDSSGNYHHLKVERDRILRSGRYFLKEPFPTGQTLPHDLTEFLGPGRQASIQEKAWAGWNYRQQSVELATDSVAMKELIYLFNIFDDYIFRRTLKRWTTLICVENDGGTSREHKVQYSCNRSTGDNHDLSTS